MKTRLMLLAVGIPVLLASIAIGAQYSGVYVLSSGDVTVTLVLNTDAKGSISGTMSSTRGTRFNINGALEEDIAVGVCSGEGGNAYFEAELRGNKLRLTMFEIGADNTPDYSKTTSLEFTKQSEGDATALKSDKNPLTSSEEKKTVRNPLAQKPIAQKAPADPFVGTFRGQDLELSLQGAGGKYSGTLRYSGQTFPAQARNRGGNAIEGTFESGGSVFPFSATLTGEVMNFVTENVQYSLKKGTADQSTGQQQEDLSESKGPSSDRSPSNAVSDPQMGISFMPPSGWKVQKQPEGYVLGSETHKGVIVIMPHEYNDLRQMGNEAMEGIVDEESGTHLQLSSQIEPFGKNGIAGEFKGMFQGQTAKAYAVGLISPRGGGVIILTAVESKSYTNAYPQFVQSIASSIFFIQPQAEDSLMRYFAGRYYSYTSGSTMSGSAGTERQIMLCPNGNFYDSSEFSASGQGGVDWGGAGSGGGSGRWKIGGSKTQGIITIMRPNGSSEEVSYQVTGEEGVILFNGMKFAYAGAPDCH